MFYKLLNYIRKFNKELADNYDEILEEELNDEFDYEDYWNNISYVDILRITNLKRTNLVNYNLYELY